MSCPICGKETDRQYRPFCSRHCADVDLGRWLTGLAGDGNQSLYACDFKGPVAVVIGSEGEGMRRLTREACDFIARIPMQGSVESLNVSVATGVVLFEVLRQRTG